MVRGSGSYAFALALSCLFVAVMGAKHRMEEHEDKLKKASSIGLFMALVEPLVSCQLRHFNHVECKWNSGDGPWFRVLLTCCTEAFACYWPAAPRLTAWVERQDPVDVTFPLSSEHELQFLASRYFLCGLCISVRSTRGVTVECGREGLMHHVQQKSSDYDLNKDHHKIELREKTMRNAVR
eukprot:3941564-Rhodomonas_salina.4